MDVKGKSSVLILLGFFFLSGKIIIENFVVYCGFMDK